MELARQALNDEMKRATEYAGKSMTFAEVLEYIEEDCAMAQSLQPAS